MQLNSGPRSTILSEDPQAFIMSSSPGSGSRTDSDRPSSGMPRSEFSSSPHSPQQEGGTRRKTLVAAFAASSSEIEATSYAVSDRRIVDHSVPLSGRSHDADTNERSRRYSKAHARLLAADDRDGITFGLLAASQLVVSRTALFGVKREHLVGLAGPGRLSSRIAGKKIQISPTLRASLSAKVADDTIHDPGLREALGLDNPSASPPPSPSCLLATVRVENRSVLMLYVETSQPSLSQRDRAEIEDLCEIAGERLRALLTSLRNPSSVRTSTSLTVDLPSTRSSATSVVAPHASKAWAPAVVESSLAENDDDTKVQNSERIGRYEICDLITHGGMGTVYTCRLADPGPVPTRLYALKIIRKTLRNDPNTAAMFLREAQVLAKTNHPNLVHVIDHGTHDGSPYIVMDYIEGCNFNQLLAASPNSRPPALVTAIVLDLLKGLHAAHTVCDEHGRPQHLVHCDVSPHNLLVGLDGACRLTDFGIARSVQPSNVGEQVRGKPGYLSPEQVRGATLDARSDIFSVGIVLYNALTGTRLFQARSVDTTLQNVLQTKIAPPSEVGLRPPKAFDRVCMKALARDCEQRYHSAQEMLLDLRSVALSHTKLADSDAIAEWVRRSLASETSSQTMRGYAVGSGLADEHLDQSQGQGQDGQGADDASQTTDTDLTVGAHHHTQTLRLPPRSRAKKRIPTSLVIVLLAIGTWGLYVGLSHPERIQSALRELISGSKDSADSSSPAKNLD